MVFLIFVLGIIIGILIVMGCVFCVVVYLNMVRYFFLFVGVRYIRLGICEIIGIL